MFTIREAQKVAHNWFDQHREKFNGLIGAYFSGSLSYMDDDAEFPFYSDIDIKVVVEDERSLTRRHDREEFGSYLIEWAIRDKSEFASSAAILGDRYISQDLLASDIIFEKDGWLSNWQ